ncbi:MAG: hypothetical protein AABZ33_02085 [Chloroflexota bacterium]
MNVITRRAVRTAISCLAVGAIAVTLAAPALASHVLAHVTVPDKMTVGETVAVAVDLRAGDRTPLPGTTVIFYLHVSFGGVAGEAEIGRAVTDETGVANLAYRPRLAGRHELRMEYVASDDGAVEVISTAFDVTGGEQLYRSAAGVDVPGVDAGLVMATLATVWSILFLVTLRLVAIARAGGASATPGLDQTR